MGPLLDPEIYPARVGPPPESQISRFNQPNAFLQKLQEKYPFIYECLRNAPPDDLISRINRDRLRTTYEVDYCRMMFDLDPLEVKKAWWPIVDLKKFTRKVQPVELPECQKIIAICGYRVYSEYNIFNNRRKMGILLGCSLKNKYILFCVGYYLLAIVQCQTDKKTKDDGKEFECPQQVGNGNFADPGNCRRFFQCVDGYPYVNRCPSGLYFDDISKLCTFKNEVRCGPIATTPAPITEPPTDLAVKCNPAECELPYCFCSKDGTLIPGGLKADDIPQMILLTFDGAVNLNNYEHYQKVLNKKRQNPNGCDLKGTFFISHEYSNYQMIQKLASDGHEMATETISLQSGLQDKGYEEWVGEMVGMREILKHLSNVSKSEVVGMRAPFLKPGRNTQYKVIEDFGYIFDSSIGVPPSDIPVWPYTLDYKIPHECKSGTCPTRSFPGVWEVPLNEHYVRDFEGGHCPYLDQCVLHNSDANEVFEWLQEDFSRYYEQNKAPYMMPFHTNWFSIKELEKGLHKFLDWATTLPDVYFVTVTQALTWITDPKTLDQLNNYEAWDCQKKKENIPPPPCNISNKCALNFKTPDMNFTDIRYLETCFECPNQYPWLGDAGGSGIPGKDNYVPDNVK